MDDDVKWLIWSNDHKRWWAHGSLGYVDSRRDAGLYYVRRSYGNLPQREPVSWDSRNYQRNDGARGRRYQIAAVGRWHKSGRSDQGGEDMRFNKRQTATVLAALRTYQRVEDGAWPRWFGELVAEIVGDPDCQPPLERDEINELCEAINCDPEDEERSTPAFKLLAEAVAQWGTVVDDEDESINGADAVDWLVEFISDAQSIVRRPGFKGFLKIEE